MTVSELLARISARELAEWIAWYNIEPFGESRADLRSAIIACVVHNSHCTKKGQMKKVNDFMTKFGPPKQMDWRIIKKALKGMT